VIQATTKDTLKVLVGLVTRLRAKRLKEAFNGLRERHELRWTSRE